MADEDRAVLIMVTAGGRDDAERLGEGLVVDHLAGHCSVVPMVHSFYYTDGRLQRETVALLMIRTVKSRAQAVYDYLRTNHSYAMPEIYEVAIEGGSPPSLEWLADQVAKPGSNR